MKKAICLVSLLLLFGAGAVQAGAKADAEAAIAAAAKAQKKASSIPGGAWVTTDKLIKKAKEAAKKGDHAKAVKLANRAAHEAELAHKQAKYEEKNWAPPPYLR